MKANNEEGKLMVGKLIENVKVLAVKDSSGKHVFENTEEDRQPAYLIFGVKSEINILLRKASYMGNYSVVLFPVPHGVEVKAKEGETMVTCKDYAQFVKNKLKTKIKGMEKKPVLAIIQVGDNQASNSYVKGKVKDCEEVVSIVE